MSTPSPKPQTLSALDELLWAIIGLLLTISGVFIEVAVPLPTLSWPLNWQHLLDWEHLQTYSLGTTLQVGAVLLVGCMGGRNAAVLSQIAYLALGLSGIQIFANGGGWLYFKEPSFGYLLGFLPAAFLCGTWAFRKQRSLESLLMSCMGGLLAIHLTGLIYVSVLSLLRLPAENWGTLVWKFSIFPLPGQLILACAIAVLSFLLRVLLFY